MLVDWGRSANDQFRLLSQGCGVLNNLSQILFEDVQRDVLAVSGMARIVGSKPNSLEDNGLKSRPGCLITQGKIYHQPNIFSLRRGEDFREHLDGMCSGVASTVIRSIENRCALIIHLFRHTQNRGLLCPVFGCRLPSNQHYAVRQAYGNDLTIL